MNATILAFSKLDVPINNAGVLLAGAKTDEMPVENFDEHVRSNIRTAFLMTKFALPYLRKTRGNIIRAGSAAPRASCIRSWRAWTHQDTGAVDAKIEKSLISTLPFGRRAHPKRWPMSTPSGRPML